MSKNHVTPVHRGKVLHDELEGLGISQSALAEHLGVLPKTINEICRGGEARNQCRNCNEAFAGPWCQSAVLA